VGIAEHRIEAVGVILNCRKERQPGELGQSGAMNCWPKAKIAQLLETFPGRHTLILLEGVVPYLGRTGKMI
jgi:hypothetical protein